MLSRNALDRDDDARHANEMIRFEETLG